MCLLGQCLGLGPGVIRYSEEFIYLAFPAIGDVQIQIRLFGVFFKFSNCSNCYSKST